MADNFSSNDVCRKSQSLAKGSQAKTNVADSADEYKETKNVRMICGNSESLLQSQVKTK